MKLNGATKWGLVLMAVTVPAVVIGYIVYGFIGRNHLIDHHGFVSGKVVKCTKSVKGRPEACNVHYTFILAGHEYEGVTLFGPAELTYEDCQTHLTGHDFPVVYESGNAGNSVILLSAATGYLYGYTFPDSLKWVAQCVHDRP